jgi:Fe-Mn family superoxide dismutase
MAFTLPPLPYPATALEPHIDARTMEIHHGKHHNAYVTNLNAALEKNADLAALDIAELCRRISKVPEAIRTAVRNNGGGHYNHSLFWTEMAPKGGGEPAGPLASAIAQELGGLAKFREEFAKAGATRFGSGWAWLSLDDAGKLFISSTPNQDNPLMQGIVDRTGLPILGLDVWEHAYYLHYQNRRPDYIAAWWNTVDWAAVGRRYEAAKKGR